MSKSEVIRQLKIGAEKGNPVSMNYYGRCLEGGWKRTPKKAAAMKWYKKSAEAGSPIAMRNYGIALEDGFD
jgi:TPR repeat protein